MIAAARESAVVDGRGVVRLILVDAHARVARCGDVTAALERAIDDDTTFGDVGRALPDVFVLRGARIGEFAGMAEAAQIVALALDELAGVGADERVVIITVPKRA